MPASHVAYNGILGAVEHLHLFRTTFMATGLLYPAAYYTVLRSALMGAAQAVWVLVGPRPKWLDHALWIFIDDVTQKRKLINGLVRQVQMSVCDGSVAEPVASVLCCGGWRGRCGGQGIRQPCWRGPRAGR
jgi:hypothetical protein